jgi:hypothetical protein
MWVGLRIREDYTAEPRFTNLIRSWKPFVNRNYVHWAKVTQQLTLFRRYSQLVTNRCCRLACSLPETFFFPESLFVNRFVRDEAFVNRFVRDERRSWTEVPLYICLKYVQFYNCASCVLADLCLCHWCFLCLALWGDKFPYIGARTVIIWKRIELHRDLGRRLGWISMPDCKFLLVSAGICILTADLVLLATFQ